MPSPDNDRIMSISRTTFDPSVCRLTAVSLGINHQYISMWHALLEYETNSNLSTQTCICCASPGSVEFLLIPRNYHILSFVYLDRCGKGGGKLIIQPTPLLNQPNHIPTIFIRNHDLDVCKQSELRLRLWTRTHLRHLLFLELPWDVHDVKPVTVHVGCHLSWKVFRHFVASGAVTIHYNKPIQNGIQQRKTPIVLYLRSSLVTGKAKRNKSASNAIHSMRTQHKPLFSKASSQTEQQPNNQPKSHQLSTHTYIIYTFISIPLSRTDRPDSKITYTN